MELFTIVLLPSEEHLHILDGLKLKFNKEGYRHKSSDTTTHSHITLAQGNYENVQDIHKIKEGLVNLLKDQTCITADVEKITKDRRDPNEKANYINYWISLTFHNIEINKLSRKINSYLVSEQISATKNYIEKVRRIDKTAGSKQIVGDHLNLCNYCREEKSDEAYQLVNELSPKVILFDYIGFRYKKGDLAWRIPLAKA